MGIVEAGRLNSVSLFARFDFPRAALPEAFDGWLLQRQSGPAPKPREVATYTHELAHYIHYTTTPYGLFLQLCRVLQNHAIIGLVNRLLQAGCSVRLPLLHNLPAMSDEVAAQVAIPLSIWLNVEDLAVSLNGDGAKRAREMQFYLDDRERVDRGGRPMRPPLFGLRHAFLWVQHLLADIIEDANAREAEKGRSDKPIYPTGIDRVALKQEAELPENSEASQ